MVGTAGMDEGKKTMRLIDADAMLETLKRKYPQWYTGKPKDNWMHYVCLVYYWAVKEAPTIDAVPATIEGALGYLHKVGWIQEHDRIMTEDAVPVRHGRWIKNDPHCDGLAFLWNCSKCGAESEEGYRYCPACGARMDAKE